MAWDRESDRKAGKAMGIGITVFAIVFILFWCLNAMAIGGGIMLIFGLPMLGFMIFRLVVLLKKSKAEKQPKEPWEQPSSRHTTYTEQRDTGNEDAFCPYCGAPVQSTFEFCPKCGRRQN